MLSPPGPAPITDALIDLTAGSLGGIALVYVGQPLDTIKVKLQTFPSLYKGAVHCFWKTLKTEGLRRGLYAGTAPALLANVSENAVLFAAYGFCQKTVAMALGQKSIDQLSPVSNAMAGFMAAFFSSFALCPTELIKVQLQAANELNSTRCGTKASDQGRLNAYHLTRKILKAEGIKGMFRGLTSTMAREMPGYFAFFGAYEGSRELLTQEGTPKEDCGPLVTMVAGAVGGVALWTLIFPADLVKSRIQVNSLEGTFVSNTRLIIKNEGVSALYSGLSPTLLRTIPATAVLFLTYETSKKSLQALLM